MRTYDSYKDSGIEWIGEIPRHWECVKLKFISKVNSGSTPKDNPENWNEDIPWITPSDIGKIKDNVYINDTSRKLSEIGLQSCGCNLNPPYSVVITNRGPIGNVIVPTMEFTTNQGCKTIIPFEQSFKFFYYYLYISNNVLNSLGQGTTFLELSTTSLKDFRFPLPPFSEQEQIVSYLDEKTSLIDEMVEKKKRKIELLKEYRTSLINTVVTKGLNPDVPMKDSGIEWIGEIPRHWELKRLKYVCNVRTGSRDTQDRVEDGLYPFFVRSPIVEKINSYSFDGEGVLTVGDGVGTGKVFHYFNGKFEYHQRVYLFSNFSDILGKYFFDYMKVKFINVTEDQNSKSTVDSLRRPLIDNFTFVLPPLSEQEQIVSYLDEKTSEIDKTIELENKKIELLKEYRQSLISNVVTGKIKVVSE